MDPFWQSSELLRSMSEAPVGVVDNNAPPATQMKILEPEMIALQRCLKAS
jgi:hypothetical protein